MTDQLVFSEDCFLKLRTSGNKSNEKGVPSDTACFAQGTTVLFCSVLLLSMKANLQKSKRVRVSTSLFLASTYRKNCMAWDGGDFTC